MIHLKEFEKEADIKVDAFPNVIYVNDTKSVLYNYFPLGVFIQHIDGRVFSTDGWTDGGFANDQANGVVVSTDAARFVIAKDNVSTSMNWASNTSTLIDGILTTKNSEEAKTDFAGLENTELMLTVDTSGAGYSCANYTFPNGSKGYLPALGEWNIAYQNKSAINAAMTLIGGTALGSNYYWSSSQGSASNAWGLNWSDGSAYNGTKSIAGYVRAFSALTL